jgi:hypothetical protein
MQQPAVRQRIAAASHDASCVNPVMQELVAALVGGATRN